MRVCSAMSDHCLRMALRCFNHIWAQRLPTVERLTKSGFVVQSIGLIEKGIESGAKRENKSPETRITVHFGCALLGIDSERKSVLFCVPNRIHYKHNASKSFGGRRGAHKMLWAMPGMWEMRPSRDRLLLEGHRSRTLSRDSRLDFSYFW